MTDAVAAEQVAARMADAARAWLDALEPEQRAVAVGDVPADDATDPSAGAGSTRRPTTAG